MKVIVKLGTLVLALGLGAPQVLADEWPGNSASGDHRPLYRGAGQGYGHGYRARPVLGMRRWNYLRAYSFRPHRFAYAGYAPRARYYAYRPRVRYAYAETPYAYDIPQETYATGIFPTVSAIGLHTYDYAYTTRVRPIAAYGGLTGSYAGGYPIYNRPLAPAYPTPGCDCEY
jgi:hypothetical protein